MKNHCHSSQSPLFQSIFAIFLFLSASLLLTMPAKAQQVSDSVVLLEERGHSPLLKRTDSNVILEGVSPSLLREAQKQEKDNEQNKISNQAPIATADNYTLFAGSSISIAAPGILANDIDPNGEDLIATAIIENVTNGTLSAFADGSFTYTPNPGFTGTDQFSYRIRNASFSSSEPAVVSLEVLPPPDKDPIATLDTYTLFAGSSLSIAAPGILANDIDPNGEDLTATAIIENVTNGTLSAFADGSFTYIPNPGFTGTDQFSYRIRNASFFSSEQPAVVNLEVLPPPDKDPIATADSYTLFAGSSISIAAPGILANDIDPNGEALTATAILQGVTNGTLSAFADGSFSYTPNPGFTGTDQFSYQIRNASFFSSEPAVVSLKVVSLNQAPIANAGDDQNLNNCLPVMLDGSGSSDPNGDPLTYTWYDGATIIAGPTTDPIVEVALSLGSHIITLEVDDGLLNDTDEVAITIEDNTPPVITLNGDSEVVLKCGMEEYTELGATVTDECDPDVAVVISGMVETSTSGTYIITYTATDASGNAAAPLERTVIIEDTTPPVITIFSAPIMLWPPNHDYHTLSLADLDIMVEDQCDKEVSPNDVVIVSVASDELEDAKGGGDGFTTEDMVIGSNCQSVDLRAERLGAGNGRVYTLTLKVADASGNVGVTTYEVHIPHNKKAGPLAIGDAPLYEVIANDCDPSVSSPVFARTASNKDNKNAAKSPASYVLEPNYPNPFSIETRINFVLPEAENITLRVLNMQGQEVALLVSGYQEAGRHEVIFDASDLQSGIYLYRLESSSFSMAKKMILIK